MVLYVNKFKGINIMGALFDNNDILNTYKQVLTTNNNNSIFVLRINDEKTNKIYGFKFVKKGMENTPMGNIKTITRV